jgi:hypothetical protein
MIANLVTIGVHDPTILDRSLIADIALPMLLLAHIPLFVGRAGARRVLVSPAAGAERQ